MKKFEFASNTVDLDIAGNEFHIDLTENLLSEIGNIKTEAAEQLSKLKTTDGNIISVYSFLEEKINRLLGDNAAESIFKDRRVNLFDLTDVLNFVIVEISNAINKKTVGYSKKK